MIESDSLPPFEKNDSVYNSNDFFPSISIRTSLPSICRGHKIATVVIYPIQFNPVTKELKVLKNIDFSIQGMGSIESDKDNIIFENFLENNVINYVPDLTPDYNIDLLILTPNEYYEALVPFKLWKEKTGVRTRIVTKSELENTPPNGYEWIADPTDDGIYSGIDKYIKDAYDNWGSLAPEYILLIGEPEILPTHYWFDTDGQGLLGTDYYYSTMDLENPSGNWISDFPDLFIGRFSIESIDELIIIRDKVINYEKNPFVDEIDWFTKVSLAGQFEWLDITDTDDCNEYRYFVYTSELIGNFLNSEEYELDRIYTYNGDCTIGKQYANEEPVPNYIDFYDDDITATNAVISSINNGCLIVNHRDHGVSRNMDIGNHDGWEHPEFNESHISGLTNTNMLPVMFSINCGTAWFDGETDYDGEGEINEDCLGELLLNHNNGGIVGFIGASRSSSSGYNDEFCKGLYDAIWPNFDLYYSEIGTPVYNLGAIKNHGLFFMNNKYIE